MNNHNKMRIYVVSCSEERQQRLKSASKSLNLDLEVVSSPWSTEEEVQRRGKECFENNTAYPTGFAATLGHIRAMKVFIETGSKYCMIVEDDVRFHKQFNDIIPKLEEYMDKSNFDIFTLGFVNFPNRNYASNVVIVYNQVVLENVTISNPFGCQCYMISRDYAKKVVELLSVDNIYEVYKKNFVTDYVFYDTDLCRRCTLQNPIVVEDPNEQTLAGNNNKPNLFKYLNKDDYYFNIE